KTPENPRFYKTFDSSYLIKKAHKCLYINRRIYFLTKPISDADKRLLKLRYECKWPQRRIAAVLKMSPGHVSRKLAQLSTGFKKRREPRIRFITPISLSIVEEEF